MKADIERKEYVPREFMKYYYKAALVELAEAGIANKQELEVFQKYVNLLLKNSGFKFLGWAFAKPACFDVLNLNGQSSLAIAKDIETGQKVMINVNSDSIEVISLETIKSQIL